MRRSASALAAVLVIAASIQAAEPLQGNWRLIQIGAVSESTVAIVKAEMKDGKPCAAVVFSRPNVEVSITNFTVTDAGVTLALKTVQSLQQRKIEGALEFVGVRGADNKVILGSTGDDRFRSRAKLVATDKTELATNELITRTELPAPMQEVQKLGVRANQLLAKARQEQDADTKKELQNEALAAQREADEKSANLYRETITKHADSPAAFDATMSLIRTTRGPKLSPNEAMSLVGLIKQLSESYGPRFANVTMVQVAEALISRPSLEGAALTAIEPVAKAVTDEQSAALQSRVLTTYLTALEKTGRNAEAKSIAERLAVIEKKLDDEFLVKVPPFKPEHFAGRKEKGANQVVVMELFTGAQCPPCVAADVAFDALGHSYKPSELVLIQYHMHIPGPDPMVNPDCIARWDYYSAKSPQGVRGTPTVVFNGEVKDLRGGGPMAASEAKFKQYREVIDPLLEKSAAIKVTGNTARQGDNITINVDVAGADPADKLTLRLIVVEDVVKFVGGNSLRFHHHVVRGMPGGSKGVEITDKNFRCAKSFDIAEVRQGLDKYLTAYAADKRPFPQPGRPMDMKDLKVIALVQNDATGAILQATQIDVK
jgi:hypothetical protein